MVDLINNKNFFTLLLLVSYAFTAEPDTTAIDIFTGELAIRYAAEFNQIPIGTRASGMGNSGAILPYSKFAAYWNPALASLDDKRHINVEGAKLYGALASLGAVEFYTPVQKGIFVGLQYAAFFPGDIQMWDSIPLPYEEMQYQYNADGYASRGIFHNNHHRVTTTISKKISIPIPRTGAAAIPIPLDIGVGLNVKALWETIDANSATRMGMNINLDFGVVARVGIDYDFDKQRLKREFLISLSWLDLLPTKMQWLNSYENYEEPVQRTHNYGLGYIDRSGFLRGNWTVSLALKKQYDVSVHVGLEGEFFDIVAFRVGYSDKIATLGCGVHYRRYSLDYSFSFDELKYSPLRLTVGVAF